LANEILLKKSVIAVALTLASTQVVMAQDAANAPPIQKVTVTGSNIKRIDSETATPVQTIKREEIQRLGVNSVKELVDSLTAATGSLSDIGGSNSFAGGASSASLRNLGKQSTLILLNSRRVAPYALADYNEVFTNLDALPLEAVERVDILRNGGSAIYGSDAVAGVINIITKGNYQGLSAKADHTRSLKNGVFNTTKASITGGFGDFAVDKYNILANVEVFHRNGVVWRDVIDDINPAYGKKFGTVAEGSGLSFGRRGTPSTFSYPGNILGNATPAVAGCAVKNAAKLCVYDRFSRFEVEPKADRTNLLVSGKFNLGEKLEGYSELLLSNTKTKYINAFQTYDSTASDTNWGDPATNSSNTFAHRFLPPTHPLNTSGDFAPLRYRFVDSDGTRTTDSSQYRLLAGLKGSLGKYEWDSAIGVMGSKTTDRQRGSFSAAGFKQVIGDPSLADADGNTTDPLFFNRAYKIGQINSAEVTNILFPQSGYDAKISQTFWDGKLTGDIGAIDGRPIGLALGGDLRHETFKILPFGGLVTGDVVGNGVVSSNASRSTSALFVEANFPVLKTLELTTAARIDKFPGFAAHISPKVAFRFEATPALLFRGTAEGGFRAPNLTESATSTKFAFNNGNTDPKRCDQAQALANDLRNKSDSLPSSDPKKALYAARADIVEQNECAGGIASIVRNNPDLKPETTKSWTLGFVLEPIKNVTFSMDYWNIKRKDEINTKDAADLLAAEDTLPAGVINRAGLAGDKTFLDATDTSGLSLAAPGQSERDKYGVSKGRLISTVGKFENIASTKTSGIDLGASSRFNTAYGKLELGMSATYLIEYREFSAALGTYGDNLAGRYSYPKTTANINASMQTGKITNGLRFVYSSATSLNKDFSDINYTNASCAGKKWTNEECGIEHTFRLDYSFTYTGIKNLTLSANIRNLTGRRTPLDLRDFERNGGGVIPQDSYDVTGRILRLGAEYKFF
jgi:iron complex outermembrane receptor protein